MRLSEGILLGSTTMKAQAGILSNTDQSAGCALGMAASAAGCSWETSVEKPVRTKNIELIWPWTINKVRRPCGCWFMRRFMPAKEIIAHLFDKHVMLKKDWTLDALSAWVRLVEPQEIEMNEQVLADLTVKFPS